MGTIFQLLISVRTSGNHNANFDALPTSNLFCKTNPCRERHLLEALLFSRSDLGSEKIPCTVFILCKDVFHDYKGVSENIEYAFASGEISLGTLRNEK